MRKNEFWTSNKLQLLKKRVVLGKCEISLQFLIFNNFCLKNTSIDCFRPSGECKFNIHSLFWFLFPWPVFVALLILKYMKEIYMYVYIKKSYFFISYLYEILLLLIRRWSKSQVTMHNNCPLRAQKRSDSSTSCASCALRGSRQSGSHLVGTEQRERRCH